VVRSHAHGLPKKVRRLGLKCALSVRALPALWPGAERGEGWACNAWYAKRGALELEQRQLGGRAWSERCRRMPRRSPAA